jgi:hypothetical protein
MATHFVYRDPDRSSLSQGDILDKTSELVTLLPSFQPHDATDPEHLCFMVLTQGCDLVRRDGRPAACSHITLAPARPLQAVLRFKAMKYQEEWQAETSVVSTKNLNTLRMFLERLLDNNEPDYFYLHSDATVGIFQHCCVFLRLAIPLAAEHYDLCLRAKTAQLEEPFPAKLGALIGNMYSQVGTPEWDEKNPQTPVRGVASEILKSTFVNLPDEQIEEGMRSLQSNGGMEGKSSQEIFQHVKKTQIVPRSRRFQDRADVLFGGTLSWNRFSCAYLP